MRGRGRGRSNWRSGAAAAGESPPEVDTFPAPPVNDQSPAMDFYQQNLPAPAVDVKMDVPVSDSDASMQEGEQQAETRKRPWEKPGGIKIKRKKVPGAKNLKIRRYVQPKNAVMCLNELRPGVTYTTEQEGGVGQPFCISVEVSTGVDSQKYRGFGSSKQLAKQAAAEAALISFVKPPVTTNNTENQEEDKTPWATLASFAIYKLFNDWREGRVGMCPPPAQPYGTAVPPGYQAFLNQQTVGTTTVKEETPQAAAFAEAICAHLGGRAPNTPATDAKDTNLSFQSTEPMKVPNPAKQVPENAAGMHPVMVLHQMKPGLQYTVSQTMRESKPFFSVTADIDGKEFSGEGPNVKKAKFFLAKEAILGLYGVESSFETPA
ncbi:double-stranded RNA-specific editase 1-like isoform X2 [Homarus americanus]|uniref:double-stranded RNA-specific editase 1-like isoform X2 n=1 Tax=Homarus americanus TaxID=6706 RepID=UPI001C447D88|nr:double-stranded RNA-specific editase 1-like isoform X2 [Homarus americanus]